MLSAAKHLPQAKHLALAGVEIPFAALRAWLRRYRASE